MTTDIKRDVKARNEDKTAWLISETTSTRVQENEFFLSHVTEGDRVLEIACGRGRLTEPLAAATESVTTVDLSREMVESTKNRLGPDVLRYAVADAENLPFCEGSFDVVLASQVVGHLPNPKSWIDEVARVLGPDGTLAFSTGNLLNPLNAAYQYKSFFPGGTRHLSIWDYLNRDMTARTYWITHQGHQRDTRLSIRDWFTDSSLAVNRTTGTGLVPGESVVNRLSLGPLQSKRMQRMTAHAISKNCVSFVRSLICKTLLVTATKTESVTARC